MNFVEYRIIEVIMMMIFVAFSIYFG